MVIFFTSVLLPAVAKDAGVSDYAWITSASISEGCPLGSRRPEIARRSCNQRRKRDSRTLARQLRVHPQDRIRQPVPPLLRTIRIFLCTDPKLLASFHPRRSHSQHGSRLSRQDVPLQSPGSRRIRSIVSCCAEDASHRHR